MNPLSILLLAASSAWAQAGSDLNGAPANKVLANVQDQRFLSEWARHMQGASQLEAKFWEDMTRGVRRSFRVWISVESHYRDAYALAAKNGDECRRVQSGSGLAAALNMRGRRPSERKSLLEEVVAAKPECGITDAQRQQARAELGLLYMVEGDAEKAEAQFASSRDFYKKSAADAATGFEAKIAGASLAFNSFALGYAAHRRKDFAEARSRYARSREELSKAGLDESGWVGLAEARLVFDEGRTEESLALLDRAAAAAKASRNPKDRPWTPGDPESVVFHRFYAPSLLETYFMIFVRISLSS